VAVYLGLALALSGKPDEAEAVLQANNSRPETLRWLAGEYWNTRAWIAIARQDLPTARRYLEAAAREGEKTGDLICVAAALHALIRLAGGRDAVQRLRILAGTMGSALVAAQAAHADALAGHDPERLLAVSEEFAAMGADLLAAEAAFDAAVAYRHGGDPRSAGRADRHAESLASRCEGAMTPGLRASQPRALLTRCERETAMLASAGHTNREISCIQQLSKRTVQNRLQQVYLKLGVSGREELGAVLGAE
jgi:DNA-binding CsgD family transcriptional regulator